MKIALKSSDGESFEIEVAISPQSQTITRLMSATKIALKSSDDESESESISRRSHSMSTKIAFKGSDGESFEMDEAFSLQSQETSHLFFRNSASQLMSTKIALNFPIKKFSLKYHMKQDSEIEMMACVCPWICNAVERGVSELKVNLMKSHGQFFMPCELFRSKTLVNLTLGTKISLGKLPPDVSLPALKSLVIDSIFFTYGDLCDVLLPGCPVLEELSVRHEYYHGYPYCISSKTIKKLSVHYECECEFDNLFYMSFDTPSLVSLDYSDYALFEYPQVNLESLVKARLDIRYSEMVKEPDVSALLTGISNVKTLYLSPASAHVIARCVKHGLLLPVFDNLVNLSFGSKNKRGWKLLPYLLKQSPKLETLTIKDLDGYTDDVSLPPNQVKVLRILDYRGTAQELEQLKGLLTEFKCLELVQVGVTEEDDDIILQDLKMLPGVSVSSKCHIKVTYFAS